MTEVIELTEQQQKIVDAEGDFLLLACPGSGKTRSAAARVRKKITDGQKVAICSYTNVGANRFQTMLGAMQTTVGPEHVVSTVHSFLLRYVVYPFGSTVGAKRGPHIADGAGGTIPFGGDYKKQISVGSFRLRPDGSLKVKSRPVYLMSLSEEEIIADVGEEVRKVKRRLLRDGYVTFDDAMFVALAILRKHPELAAAVARRFDELLLDEAQDTSELQLACVDEIKAAGLESLVMVGDLEQSIFAFQGASADGCRELASTHGLRTIDLTENHRCSQRICNVAVHFCERDKPDLAVGPHAQCDIEPELIFYPPDQPAVAVERFRERLALHDADPANAAVLARGNLLVAELNGTEAPVDVADRPMALGRATAALRHGTITRRQLDDVQRIVASAAWEEHTLDSLFAEDRDHLREQTIRLLVSTPSLEGDLRAWIQQAAGLLTTAATALNNPPAKKGGQLLKSKTEQEGTPAKEVFLANPRVLEAQTIHDIKGEDRDAVLVVLDRPRSAKRDPQTQLWSSALAGDQIDIEQAEEKRIAFVALTRAMRLCVVALPDDADGRAAAEAFISRGFMLRPATHDQRPKARSV
jgi:DNA helicase-2/ATP-dependent DNA helicase PcrA